MRRWLRLISHGDVLLPLGLHFLQPFLFGRVPEGDAVPAHNIFSILHIAVFFCLVFAGQGKAASVIKWRTFFAFPDIFRMVF